MKQTGLSRSTIWRYLRDCKNLEIVRNVGEPIQTTINRKDLMGIKEKLLAQPGRFRYLIGRLESGEYAIFEQLPNAYYLHGVERLPLRKRPDYVRINDWNASRLASPKLYASSSDELSCNSTIKYIELARICDFQGNVMGAWARR
jgi:hypothetical protein